MPVPSGQQVLPHVAEEQPVVNDDPSLANPLGFGAVIAGGNTITVSCALLSFSEPVDIYGAFVMSGDPANIRILNPDGQSFKIFPFNDVYQSVISGVLPAGVQPWKAATLGPVDEILFSNMQVAELPTGTYSIYLMVTPAGRLDSYYIWSNALTVPGPIELVISPADTDAAIDPSFGSHYAYFNTVIPARGKLFLFMPASDSDPSRYRQVLQYSANNGFHTIGLAYNNGEVLEVICSGSLDPNCQGNVRGEILTGQDLSLLVSVDPANSIVNRLTKVLSYLEERRPGEGWGQYVDTQGNLRWDLIRVSGHSQGGGEAGYIAKGQLVDHVCFFSSPGDFDNELNEVAGWVLAPGVTPVDRYYGFFHQRDGVIPATVIQRVWPALQMDTFGTYVNVDDVVPPYDGSHMLTTNLDRPMSATGDDGTVFHKITVTDGYTPLDWNGLPTYRATWQYQCF